MARNHPWGKNNIRLQVIVSREREKVIRREARKQGVSVSRLLRLLIEAVVSVPPPSA